MRDEMEYFHAAIRAGIDGYLLKQETGEELFTGIHTIRAGRRFLSPLIASTLGNRLIALCQNEQMEPAEVLTPRKRQVLKLVTYGASANSSTRIFPSAGTRRSAFAKHHAGSEYPRRGLTGEKCHAPMPPVKTKSHLFSLFLPPNFHFDLRPSNFCQMNIRICAN